MSYDEALALTTPLVRLCNGTLGRIVGFRDAEQSVEVRRADGAVSLIPVAALAHGLWCAVETAPPGDAAS
jgi:hypothetical protein